MSNTSTEGGYDPSRRERASEAGHRSLLYALERLLSLAATTLEGTLTGASTLVADTLGADKVDAFLHEPTNQTLVAVGVSDTPLARHQQAIGLDRLPIANGGSAVQVFSTGRPYHCNDVAADTGELLGIREGLKIGSAIAVPLEIGGRRRGVLHVSSGRKGAFSEEDAVFLAVVAHWVGVVAHRAELVEELTSSAELQGRQDAAEELLVVFSHDLRNHLWTVGLRLQVLQRRAEAAGRAEDIAEIGRITANIRRLEQFARNSLDVERIERGLLMSTLAPVDVAALVRETAELLSTADAPLRVESPAALILEVDAGALRQALENLVNNARTHSPAGAPIDLAVREVSPDGTATITVRDFGPGIAPDVMPRLFHRHARGRGSQGLGLGLYLARKLVESTGGVLDTEAHDGPGACFKITLPGRSAPASAPPEDARPAS